MLSLQTAGKKSYSDVCPPKSDTDAANSFGVVTQASGQGDETLPWPNERVLLCGLYTPPPWGVKVVLSGAGSQFTQGKQARQPSDKQFGLNKAFRYKGRATTGYLSCLWRPPLPLACLLPWRHLTYIHPSWLTGVRHSKRWVSKMQSLWRQSWHG